MENTDFLCNSLRGRVYYSPMDKHEVFITVDGEELYIHELLQECRKVKKDYRREDLLEDLKEIENLNVADALYSKSPVKKVMALLDERLDLKDLKNAQHQFEEGNNLLSFLYKIRFQAEGFPI